MLRRLAHAVTMAALAPLAALALACSGGSGGRDGESSTGSGGQGATPLPGTGSSVAAPVGTGGAMPASGTGGSLPSTGGSGTAGAMPGSGGGGPEPDAGAPNTAPMLPALPPGLAPYWPTSDWQTTTPAEAKIDPAGLQAAIDYAGESTTQGLLVIRYGYVVAEEYFGSFAADTRHESYSMAKSFTSALVGIAIGEGLLSGVGELVCQHYPEDWDCSDSADPRSRVTLEHLMTLSSGLSWMEDWSGSGTGVNDATRMSSSPDPIAYVLAKPAAAEPGMVFRYSTGDPALISGILQDATGMTALAYARAKLLDPIGISSSFSWRTAAGRTTTFAGIQATIRDFAKLGYLYLHRGSWDGAQVVPSDWVDVSTMTGKSLEPWYGYLWHVSMPAKFDDPTLPADGYLAMGVFGQHIMVIPSKHLVVVRVAMDSLGTTAWQPATFLGHLLPAAMD